MNKILLLFIFILCSNFLVSQTNDSLKKKTDFVPFAIIDEAPVYPGCEKLDLQLQKLCMQNQIKNHVSENFNLKVAKKLKLKPGVKRVYVIFRITKEGNIDEIKARGPHADLEKEGIRVIKSLPKMKPGKLNEKNVAVKYTLPITFLIE